MKREGNSVERKGRKEEYMLDTGRAKRYQEKRIAKRIWNRTLQGDKVR